MFDSRIVEERPCEHGEMNCWVAIPLNDNIDPPTKRCPGGSRIVLEVVEVDWELEPEEFVASVANSGGRLVREAEE